MFFVQKGRSIRRDIAEYFLTTMDDYPKSSLFRNAIYLLECFVISVFIYQWLEFAEMGGLYHWVFPLILALTIVAVQYMVTEFGGRLIYNYWKPFKINIGKFWLISFIGVGSASIISFSTGICQIVCEILQSYCPVMWQTSPPDTLDMLSKVMQLILIPWALCTFLLTLGEFKKQISKELVTIKQINDALKQKKSEIHSGRETIGGHMNPSGTEYEERSKYFIIPSKDEYRRIAIDDIYFIAVEDHYCKLVINEKGERREEFVRLSLKKALANLPSSHFAQVHRSYVVNFRYVKRIKKEGQAYQLSIEGSDECIPASRHRAHAFLPKLKEMLN